MGERIKIIKGVLGFNWKTKRKETLSVQLFKNETGMSISINEYTVPLEPLGIEIRKAPNEK